MDIQNDATMSNEEKDQSLLQKNAEENLSEMQGLPSISMITYEMLEESETKEAAVFKDVRENLELWKNMTNKERFQRIDEIHRQVEETFFTKTDFRP